MAHFSKYGLLESDEEEEAPLKTDPKKLKTMSVPSSGLQQKFSSSQQQVAPQAQVEQPATINTHHYLKHHWLNMGSCHKKLSKQNLLGLSFLILRLCQLWDRAEIILNLEKLLISYTVAHLHIHFFSSVIHYQVLCFVPCTDVGLLWRGKTVLMQGPAVRSHQTCHAPMLLCS